MTSLLRIILQNLGNKGLVNEIIKTSKPSKPFMQLVVSSKFYSQEVKNVKRKKGKLPAGKLDGPFETPTVEVNPAVEKEPLERFPNDINPVTGEIGGPRGPEPTRYGDWERKGRAIDF